MQSEIESLFRLSRSLHHLNQEMEHKFRLSLVQFFVLLRVRSLPAASPQVLATAIGIRPSSLTPTLRRLERKKFLFVTEDSKDSRRKVIALTRRGNEVVQAVERDVRRGFSRAKKAPSHRLQSTLSYLGELRRGLSGKPALRSPRLNLRPSAAHPLQ